MPRLLRIASLAAALTGAALPAAASVLSEADAPFSRSWSQPTEIGQGADAILGTAEVQNGHEFIVLTGLRAGGQTLSFTFETPDWALSSDSYSAGGQILWSTDPFRWAWDGTSAGAFQLDRWTTERTVDVILGDDFAGPLYLGVFLTHGSDVAWNAFAPGNAAIPTPAMPAPGVVPLPAGMWLMIAALALLVGLGRRKGRAA